VGIVEPIEGVFQPNNLRRWCSCKASIQMLQASEDVSDAEVSCWWPKRFFQRSRQGYGRRVVGTHKGVPLGHVGPLSRHNLLIMLCS